MCFVAHRRLFIFKVHAFLHHKQMDLPMMPPPTMKPHDASTSTHSPSLLQLVSEQVMMNLLPVMALKPGRIVQVRSADAGKPPVQEQAAAQFRFALQALAREPAYKGYQPKIIDHVLSSSAPDIAEARDFIASTLISNPGMMVNFSGGTRLMGTSAFVAAMALGRATFTCDPEHQRFLSGRTAPLAALPEFASLTRQLSVRLLMAAQGRNLDDWRSESATDAMRAFGLKAFELRHQQWGALETFNKALRAHFYCQSDKVPADAEEVKALVGKPLPPAVIGSEPARQFLAAAAAAGFVRAEGQSYRVLVPQFTKRAVERAVQLLSSGWIELAVLDCLQRNPRYQSPLWNLELTQQQSSPLDDNDIVCVDTKSGRLHMICCKATTTRSPHEHLELFAERAQRLAAGNARCTFVLFKPASGQESAIRHHARRLGIEAVIEPDEIVKAFSPQAR